MHTQRVKEQNTVLHEKGEKDLLNNERNRTACKGLKTLSPSCKHIEKQRKKQTNGRNERGKKQQANAYRTTEQKTERNEKES